jgi:threonine dehydrogenase-like Zn-dependent dehydrogenase
MMKAALFKGKDTIEPGERSEPTIKEPTDAVVRVVLTCVCGSDFWYYRRVRHQCEHTFLNFSMMC